MFVVKSEDWFVNIELWNTRVDKVDEATQFKTRKLAEKVANELINDNWSEVFVEEIK